mgnify:CR=1 FL=1
MSELKLSSFVLFVVDVPKSKEFYMRVLDQEVTMDINSINVGFKSGLAIWDKKYATNVIFENQNVNKSDNTNLEIYFETNALDEVFKKVSDMNVNILHGIKTQPWQQRVFRFYDPDKFIIEAAETMEEVIKRLSKENMTVDAIAEKTFMPKEVVQAMLG